MKQTSLRPFAALLLIVSLLCVSCNQAKGTTMRLTKTEGTVGIEDGDGKRVEPRESLMLYNGYSMETRKSSYAWIDLDDVKLTKMDERSEIEIQKDGTELEIQVNSGSLFFNITEPLAEDETMTICTSTMMVGIRGTCGWVSAEAEDRAQVYILEGTVTVEDADGTGTVKVSAGEMAQVTGGGEDPRIVVETFSTARIPDFVRAELERDEELAEEILDASGLDVLHPPTTAELAHDAYEAILAEYRDARQNALPYDEYMEHFDWDSGADPEEYMEEQSRNYEINRTNYPNISWAYWSFYTDAPTYYSAYYDVDGNGIDELFIGTETPQGMWLIGFYVFDGTQAVNLDYNGSSFDAYYGGITADGLFLTGGNGGASPEPMYRLSGDGYTLEEVQVSDINFENGGYLWSEMDLSNHGGLINDLLDWTPLS